MRRALTAVAATLAALMLTLGAPGSSAVSASTPDEPAPDAVPVTVSEFYPDEANLSDCVGLVERPGCGSEARGGWRQFAVFAAIVVGFGIIVWRISLGVRAGRAAASDSAPSGDAGGNDPADPSDTPPTRRNPA